MNEKNMNSNASVDKGKKDDKDDDSSSDTLENGNNSSPSRSNSSSCSSTNGSRYESYETVIDNASSQSSGSQNKSTASSKEEVIAQAEDKAVLRIRLMVICILVAFAVSVAFFVYYFTRKDEVHSFEQAFLEESEKIFESIGTTLGSSLGAIDAFAVSITSYAKATNSTWPFVAIPDFGVRAAKVRTLSRAYLIGQFQIVEEEDRAEWERFSNENAAWVDEALEIQKLDPTFQGIIVDEYSLSPSLFNQYYLPEPNNTGPYYPAWQQYPTIPIWGPPFNYNESSERVKKDFKHMEKDHRAIIGLVPNLLNPMDPSSAAGVEFTNAWVRSFSSELEIDHTEPYSDIYYPVFADDAGFFPAEGTGSSDSKLVSVLTVSFYWRKLIENILPPGSGGTVVVVTNACGQKFTYKINGPKATYLGSGDHHDKKYDDLVQASGLNDLDDFHSSGKSSYTGFPLSDTTCPYTIYTYPAQEAEDIYLTRKPILYTVAALFIFLATSTMFFLYDNLVERRQQKVMKTAVQSSAIVSSLFPSNVRKRLYDMDYDPESVDAGPQKARLKHWLNDGKQNNMNMSTKRVERIEKNSHANKASQPIADLFPEATVLFADIAGFTAWSSIREPSQVFVLLETMYGAFDAIATRRGVFKVETIGDSYVAVVGLPDPRPDHAVVMVKFADECRTRMSQVTRELGVTLGPDTEDLSMRFGLHSGPVTAGVLRGQKSRFQLFGDTVNTAARMESTGECGRIQVSQATADYLLNANKHHWITPRDKHVIAKGKGMMQTYWVELHRGDSSTKSTCSGSMKVNDLIFSKNVPDTTRLERLVEWNVDLLGRMICLIIQRRQAVKKSDYNSTTELTEDSVLFTTDRDIKEGNCVFDEVKEIIALPDYVGCATDSSKFDQVVALDSTVLAQLQEYVVTIAKSYKSNPFHNFEHASHVCMSVAKLMSRIVAADDAYENAPSMDIESIRVTKHNHTYGITSDPLTQFACIFSALIHDVEHPGVPNTQLVKEGAGLALRYNGRSVAEQNSVDVAWQIFMRPDYTALRKAICPTNGEMKRFRQLVVNCVMATDVMDKELKNLRDARWDRAFSGAESINEPSHTNRNRKATIVIEHLIQASDVAHTMQHWHIYRKWNERLFEETYRAYKDGRSEKNPAEYWYQDEMGFFDHYVLPLARKLNECGVFGVCSDEYLICAMRNREEWESKGEEVITAMTERLEHTDMSSYSVTCSTSSTNSTNETSKKGNHES